MCSARWAHLDVDRSRSGAELLLLLGWRRSRCSRLLSDGEPLWSLLPGERDLDKKVEMKTNEESAEEMRKAPPPFPMVPATLTGTGGTSCRSWAVSVWWTWTWTWI